MPLRFVVTKSTAQGEQITAEVAQCDPVTGKVMHSDDDLYVMLGEVNGLVDSRMTEMNVRMLEAYHLDKYFDRPTWQMIESILDILAGRQSAAMVVQRWDASREETEALERGRQEAYEQSAAGLAFAEETNSV